MSKIWSSRFEVQSSKFRVAGRHWRSWSGNRPHRTVPTKTHFLFCHLVLFLLPIKALMQNEIKRLWPVEQTGFTPMATRRPMRGEARAFTLIELLVVIAIIAILAS